MYALFSKTKYGGYKSLMSDDGESLFCMECDEYYWAIQLNELISNSKYAVFKKEENSFIIMEINQKGYVIFNDNKDLITEPLYIEPVTFGSGSSK